jgi:hypothetical protein
MTTESEERPALSELSEWWQEQVAGTPVGELAAAHVGIAGWVIGRIGRAPSIHDAETAIASMRGEQLRSLALAAALGWRLRHLPAEEYMDPAWAVPFPVAEETG